MKDAKLKPSTVIARRAKISNFIEKLRKEYDSLKQRCSHEGKIDYCSDPSGNNDSSYDCSACGASWRRDPR